ncbi:type II toxin-antitoxin system PemK/MazF family toxin [Helicobacter sp.]|uniref:type II toxin-antitoxin system PemK/MazF family toxin n=1 Tax=Helicobacter sp. TaxID=218 RepID=UPI0019B76BEA|nr:type II toxin-antitoxin system PemK/MazF family toxin [Helicobacter sp.]MBD5164979.1 type II toxin-antitoxin system PemK/MazF family toxin [Helicobacter sp.]
MNDLEKFDQWNEVKKNTHNITREKSIKEQGIYWVRIGNNIGKEIYGKGPFYTRPVLVIKITPNGFWGIPMTSNLDKTSKFSYLFVDDKEKSQMALLEQLRFFDIKRIQTSMSRISDKDFTQLKIRLKSIIEE